MRRNLISIKVTNLKFLERSLINISQSMLIMINSPFLGNISFPFKWCFEGNFVPLHPEMGRF